MKNSWPMQSTNSLCIIVETKRLDMNCMARKGGTLRSFIIGAETNGSI